MATTENRPAPAANPRRGMLLVIGAAAIVFAGLIMMGSLALLPAMLGFAAVAAAALVVMRGQPGAASLAPPLTVANRTADPLRSVVTGLPDPVIALDRNGRVLAFNEPAQALAPALRQGEPVSLALRLPDLNEAIGRAYLAGQEQRVSYSER